jgi:hypothetical protein
MDNFDSNMIKPVDSLQNITGLAPARRREQRRRRQNLEYENEQQKNKQDEHENEKIQLDESIKRNDADDTKIDFCA